MIAAVEVVSYSIEEVPVLEICLNRHSCIITHQVPGRFDCRFDRVYCQPMVVASIHSVAYRADIVCVLVLEHHLLLIYRNKLLLTYIQRVFEFI